MWYSNCFETWWGVTTSEIEIKRVMFFCWCVNDWKCTRTGTTSSRAFMVVREARLLQCRLGPGGDPSSWIIFVRVGTRMGLYSSSCTTGSRKYCSNPTHSQLITIVLIGWGVNDADRFLNLTSLMGREPFALGRSKFLFLLLFSSACFLLNLWGGGSQSHSSFPRRRHKSRSRCTSCEVEFQNRFKMHFAFNSLFIVCLSVCLPSKSCCFCFSCCHGVQQGTMMRNPRQLAPLLVTITSQDLFVEAVLVQFEAA